jgi:hypothetical protein
MAESTNRTLICSVLYLDIVDFSLGSVTEQFWLKERFNAAVTEAIAGVGANDRIILDTGGGAVLSFLDPEDALISALSVRDALATQVTAAGLRARIRTGINAGPVWLTKDVNGQSRVIGDGVNVAQSIMRFSDLGQVLVSRSYRDVMVRLSESYADLFHYEGAKTDKNRCDYEVYAVSAASNSVFRRQDKNRCDYEVYAVSAASNSVFRRQGTKSDDARKSPGRAREWTAAIVAWMRNL